MRHDEHWNGRMDQEPEVFSDLPLDRDPAYKDSMPWWSLPRSWSLEDAQELVDDLVGAWRAQMGRLPGHLDSDLASLDLYFHPLAAGRRLRPALAELPVTFMRSRYAIEPLILAVGPSQHLVTPEGRVVLDALSKELNERIGSRAHLGLAEYQRAQVRLLGLYRSWSQRRLRDVLRLQSGDAPMLLPQSLAVVLFLLVNGNTSSVRPLRRPSDPADLAVVDAKTQDAIAAFADTLSPSKATRRKDQYSLYRGYALTEARRKLGSNRLVVKGNDIFINDRVDEAVERVVSELRRREIPVDVAVRSFDALLNAYRLARPTLAAYGVAFEQPATTAAIRESIVDGLTQHKSKEPLDRRGRSGPRQSRNNDPTD
jgi:hypothetical protein